MANSNVIGQFTDELEETAEQVVEEVKDSIGEMIEQGVQSVKASPPLTPQQIQQNQEEEESKKIELRRQLKFRETVKTELNDAYQQTAEEEKQRKELEQQEEENKKREQQQKNARIISPARKVPPVLGQTAQPVELEEEAVARTRQESGKGHGVGG